MRIHIDGFHIPIRINDPAHITIDSTFDLSINCQVYASLLIEVAYGKVPLRAGWERSACIGESSFGGSFRCYSAGVVRYRAPTNLIVLKGLLKIV